MSNRDANRNPIDRLNELACQILGHTRYSPMPAGGSALVLSPMWRYDRCSRCHQLLGLTGLTGLVDTGRGIVSISAFHQPVIRGCGRIVNR